MSPLKALAADIRENLERPLAEIREVARELGLVVPDLRVVARTGDTTPDRPRGDAPAAAAPPDHDARVAVPPRHRRPQPRAPPGRAHRDRGRDPRGGAGQARGRTWPSRWSAWTRWRRPRPQRIGLSATQRPIETIARLLVGAGEGRSRPDGAPACRIVDLGHRRELDLTIELPDSELEAVASHEQWGEILDRIATHVRAHRTTLIFVNTRRLAERVAHLLGGAARGGPGRRPSRKPVQGSPAPARGAAARRASWPRWSPRPRSSSASTSGPWSWSARSAPRAASRRLLQRVGRSGHARGAVAKGRVYPTTRDELVEATALLRAVRAGQLDRVLPPRGARSTCWRSRSSPRAPPTPGPRTSSSIWSGARRPYADPRRAPTSTRSWRCCRTASRPGADAGPRISTATASTASCGAGGAPGSPR